MARKRRKTVIGRKLNSSVSSPAAVLIAGIIDLLIEILLHLPAKSLVRFKCVSKQWLSLMSHSEFSRNHSRRNPRPPISGLYFYYRTRLTSVSLFGGRNLPPLTAYCCATTVAMVLTVFAQESCYGPGVFWNGAIHWLSDQRGLIRFEVDAEKMIALPNPPTPKILGVDKVRYFGECGGGLILIQSRSCCVVGFRILQMDEDYHGWIVKCRINVRPLIDESPEMKSKICKYDGSKVLCVVKGEKEKDFALVLAIQGRKIVSFNLKSKTWDVLRDLAPGESIDYRLNGYAYPFVETLLPI